VARLRVDVKDPKFIATTKKGRHILGFAKAAQLHQGYKLGVITKRKFET